VPYAIDEKAKPGSYELTALLTYTPSFNAGKLSTHVNEPYTTQVINDPQAESPEEMPEPSQKEVPDDFQVAPKEIRNMSPFFFPYTRDSELTKFLHTIFIDPEGHNKRIRHVTYPFINSTKALGSSFGLGGAILDTTPEGVLTGIISLVGYYNEFVGSTFGFDLVTCPAAYHNLRFNVRYSGEDFQSIKIKYENFTMGKNDRWGIQTDMAAFKDPRFRFFGFGPNTAKPENSVYDHEELRAIIDGYSLPLEKLRLGVGYKFRAVDVGQGDITVKSEEDIPFTVEENRFNNVPGIQGATVTGGRVNAIYDQRNQEFNPTKGFFGKMTAEYSTVIDDSGQEIIEDNYGTLSIDLRKYFSTTDQKFIGLIRNQWVLNTSEDIPFFEQAKLGGPNSLRAFPAGRFTGQHMVFASAELRYAIWKLMLLKFPMVVQVGGFMDMGQVFDEAGINGTFNKSPGLSLRLVNYPNAGYILNAAHSRAGWNVTGGITLPF